jgi:hypothetical protein
MMNNEDIPRGIPPQQSRRPIIPNYKDTRYSPSTNYNYNTNNSYGNPQQQHPRRRVDRFKRETMNSSDRLLRQNDIIIRLLKEIRDRLPAPPASAHVEADTEEIERTEASAAEPQGASEHHEASPEGDEQGADFNSVGNEQAESTDEQPSLPPEP